MKITRIASIIAAGILMATCGVQRPSESVGSTSAMAKIQVDTSGGPKTVTEIRRLGFVGPAEAMFYHTEGLKQTSLYSDHIQASRLFDKAIETDSTFSPAYFAAATNIAMHDPELALEYSLKANELDSTNVWYKSQLGRLLVMNRQYETALYLYRDLIRTSPSDPENYRMLAALHEVSSQPFSAIAVLDSAETKFGKMEELAGYKRELLIKVNLFDQAIEETRMLLQEHPYKFENYLILGELYLTKRSDSLALVNINKAIELNPAGVEPLMVLGEYYKTIGDNTSFLATAKQILQNDNLELDSKIRFFKDLTRDIPYYAANYFTLSEMITSLAGRYPYNYDILDLYAGNLFSGGETDAGLNVYKNYLTDTTSILAPFQMIIEGEAFFGRTDSVNKYTRLALERFPDNFELRVQNAGTLHYMDRHKEALTSYGQALELADTDSMKSMVLGYIGDVYHQMGKMRDCYKYYERALTHNKDNTLVLNNYAYFLSEEGKELDKALTMASRVMELEPGNPTYIDTYAWVLFKLKRYEEAKKAMLKAISLSTDRNEEYFLHYGDILFEMGEEFMAKYYWDKALEAGYDKGQIESRLKKLSAK